MVNTGGDRFFFVIINLMLQHLNFVLKRGNFGGGGGIKGKMKREMDWVGELAMLYIYRGGFSLVRWRWGGRGLCFYLLHLSI